MAVNDKRGESAQTAVDLTKTERQPNPEDPGRNLLRLRFKLLGIELESRHPMPPSTVTGLAGLAIGVGLLVATPLAGAFVPPQLLPLIITLGVALFILVLGFTLVLIRLAQDPVGRTVRARGNRRKQGTKSKTTSRKKPLRPGGRR